MEGVVGVRGVGGGRLGGGIRGGLGLIRLEEGVDLLVLRGRRTGVAPQTDRQRVVRNRRKGLCNCSSLVVLGAVTPNGTE